MATVPSAFDVARCVKALTVIEADLNQLDLALTEAQFHAPPRSGGWSVGYCVDHLVLTGHEFLAKWSSALQEAVVENGHRNTTYQYSWWQRRILSLAEPPYKLKTKTKQSFLPCSRRPREETIRRFLSMHQDFERTVSGSRGLDMQRTKVQSPFVSWIWYPLGFSFDLALAHERRHLWQAWEVRRRLLDEL
jgi:hypothetical protein